MFGWGSARGVLTCALVCVGCGAAEDGPLLDDGPPPAGPKNVLAAGPQGPFAISGDGAIVRWRVGDTEAVPVAGLGEREWHGISMSDYLACALSAHGSVWCWKPHDLSSEPSEVSALHGRVDRLVVGGFHACVMIRDGSVECWGLGTSGQLGDGRAMTSFEPVRVEGLDGRVVDVAAGDRSSWALMDDGRVYAWGGVKAELPVAKPIEADGVVTRLCQTGDSQLCRVLEGGRFTPSSWVGELSGVRLATLPRYAAAPPEISYFAVVLESGELNAWDNEQRPPQRFFEPPNITELVTGGNYGCVANPEGVWCWGNQASGTAPPLVEIPTRVEL
ncbi:MAG: hypothetical protein H6718_20020 [Polyangiaceae bacterium]|nr:hypothetical protein [Polyangiaceae bacterium]